MATLDKHRSIFDRPEGAVFLPCCVTFEVMFLALKLIKKFSPRWVRAVRTLSPVRGGHAFLETDEDGRIRCGIKVAGIKFSDPRGEFPSKLLITNIEMVKP